MGFRHDLILLSFALMFTVGCSTPSAAPEDVKVAEEATVGELLFGETGTLDNPCYPQCEGRTCGDDGCGGSCGECPGAQDLCADGLCVCQTACDGKDCGDDGCGASCGDCLAGWLCNAGICEEEPCLPACTGKDCGSDGCDGICGECSEDESCEDGICKVPPCVPLCTGLDCGDDGCGGSCGQCEDGAECVDGLCQCVPDCGDAVCGDDGCGGSCGQCEGVLESCLGGQCVTAASLGASCTTVADCNAGGVCLLGICTVACEAGGDPAESPCGEVSPASVWGEAFGCAPDVGLCLPGEIEGVDMLCLHDSDCLDGFVCSGILSDIEPAASGVCLPEMGLAGAGASCAADADCATLLCLPDQLGANGSKRCGSYCLNNADCAAGTRCTPWPVQVGGEVADYLPLCAPLAGSLAPCQDNSQCKIGKEYCGALLSPAGEESEFVCLQSGNAQGLWAGSQCQNSGDCFEPYCVFETWSANVDAYCTHACQDVSQCPSGMECRTVGIDPSKGVWPEAEYSVNMCIKVAQGSPCFVDMPGTCAFSWSKCMPIPGVGWIGTCESGLCPSECDGKACLEDNGCGKPCLESCISNGKECDEDGECLSGFCIDGVCCASACEGICQSCVQPGSAGSCVPVLAGSDPGQECGACQRCDGQGGCVKLPPGPDDSGLCGLCQVCDAEGACVPGPALSDPLGDCGLCQLCDGQGGCAPVPGGADPKEECDISDKETCSFKGTCDGNGSCAMWPSMTPCGEETCNGSKYSPAPHCDGDGKCLVQPFENCSPYVCSASQPACLTNCQAHTDCIAGYWCNQGICESMPLCPWGQKLICNAMVPGDSSLVDNLWGDYGSCAQGASYLGGEKLYQILPNKPMRISVTVTNADFDAGIVLLDGACAPESACSQLIDFMPAGLPETFTFDATANTQYYLVVDGPSVDDSGPYSIQADCCDITCAAENACGDDGCGSSCGSCDGQALCVDGQCQECASEESGEPNDSCEAAMPIDEGDIEALLCPAGDEDWYSFTAVEGDSVSLVLDFDAEAVDFDLALYGPDCGEPLAESASPDEVEFLGTLLFNPGTYLVRVSSPGGAQGGYVLSLMVEEADCHGDVDCPPGQVCGLYECTQPPAPCPTSGKLLCGQQIEGDSSGGESGLEDYTSCSAWEFSGPETIYTMSVQEPTTTTLTLAGLPDGGAIAVLDKFCATEWACQTLAVGLPGMAAQVVAKMVPGVVYYVLVEGVSEGDAGPFILNTDCCVPQCAGLECGNDGCGTDCGPCVGEQDACVDGACVCQPQCGGLDCGDDGCGGSCGECGEPQYLCLEGLCVCQPDCAGKECGDDGCGGSCGDCEGELLGCAEGMCVCQPQCDGKECGDDGCGGKCGLCAAQELCVDDICECLPSCQGKVCGDNGCGGSCGACEGPQDICLNGFCVCQPACAPLACGDDGCGGSCASCPAGRVCSAPECVCQAEAGDPNPSCGTATGLPPGFYEGLAICPAGDEDWYSFQLTAGQKLSVSIFFEHDDGDLELFLYNKSSCSSYLKSSTSGTDDESIVFVAPASGTYAVRVLEFGKVAENAYDLEALIE